MAVSLFPSQNFTQVVCAAFIIVLIVTQGLLQVSACPDDATNGRVKVKATLKPHWTYTVRSPRFPQNYPSNTNCSWTFTLPGDYEFLVAFKHFQIESSKECRSDYIHVSFTNHSVPHWKRYCNVFSDNYIKSLRLQRWHTHVFSERMTLMFISDGSFEFKGFEAEIRTVAPALVPPHEEDVYCKNHLNDTSGSFTSPKHPHPYPTDMSCEWHISVPSGKKVHLRFTFFDLENTKNKDDDCANDFVEIREGVWGRKGGVILGRFCDNSTDTIPPQVISPSNQMWVRFTSNDDNSHEHKGFYAEFKDSSWSTGSSGFSPSFKCVSFAVLFVLTAWF